MARIELTGICKSYTAARPPAGKKKLWTHPAIEPPDHFAMQGLDLVIPDGRTTVLLGPTGCGKSTILRLIAGLERPDAGIITFDGVDMYAVPPKERGIGMVFQNYALYPHMDARSNILSAFLFRKKTPALDEAMAARLQRTSALMDMDMQLLLGRMPRTLSGGERQRVAVARCITRDPSLFLMDEPFSNLDAKLRQRSRLELKRLLREFSVTAVHVTHDQTEARILADQVVILHAGRVVQTGTWPDIYDLPADIFTADFLTLDTETPAINLFPGEWLTPGLAGRTVGVRCEAWQLAAAPARDAIEARVDWIKPGHPGRGAVYCLLRDGRELHAAHPPVAGLGAGNRVWMTPVVYHVFDAETGRRLETSRRQTTNAR